MKIRNNSAMWDRSNQNYFILRRGVPWTVMYCGEEERIDKYVCDYPAHYYDDDLIKQVCMATNDGEVKQMIKDCEA